MAQKASMRTPAAYEDPARSGTGKLGVAIAFFALPLVLLAAAAAVWGHGFPTAIAALIVGTWIGIGATVAVATAMGADESRPERRPATTPAAPTREPARAARGRETPASR